MAVSGWRSLIADSGVGEPTAGRPVARPRWSLNAYVAGFLVVAAAWLLIHKMQPVPWFPLDDAYITLHSAQVLHWGSDPNFPGVSALYGATSAPFLGLVYGLLFVLPPLYALDTACWLGVLAYVLGLVYLTRTLRLERWEAGAVVTLGLASSFVPFHLLNGLETSWALAGVIWTLALASGGSRPTLRLAALAGGCTAAIRPDLAPFTLLAIAAMTYNRWRCRDRSAKLPVAEFLVWISIAGLPLLPVAVWYWTQTGWAFPLTGLAKQFYFATGKLPIHAKLATFAPPLGLFALSCGPLLLGIVHSWRRPLGKAVCGFAALMVLLAFQTLPDGLFLNLFRYLIVLVPMLVWSLAQPPGDRRGARTRRRLLLASLLWCGLIVGPGSVRTYLEACRQSTQAQRELVSWCEQHLPGDATLLVQDVGYIAYASHFRVVDYVGLKTPQAIELNKQYTWPSAGARRAEAVAALADREGARYLVIAAPYAPSNTLPSELASLGWRLDALRTDGFYRVYRLHAPRADK